MNSRRIRIALVGLVVLVLVGWLIRDLTGGGHSTGHGAGLNTPPPYSASTWPGTQAGGRFWANATMPS
jgi:hypothetical protein